MDEASRNHFQALTSPSKLRGQYYTPDELVALMLESLHLAPRHRILDPACGDGRFLRGAVAAVARRFRGADRRALAKHWAGRLIGFDIDPAVVAAARANLRDAFAEHLETDLPLDCLHIYPADI